MRTVEFLPVAAEEEAALSADFRARLARMTNTICQYGLLNVPRDWIKPLDGKLWELRVSGKDGIARAVYIILEGQRIVIVRIFVKKTQKTPHRELELARKRAEEFL
jgi:phage-related protein